MDVDDIVHRYHHHDADGGSYNASGNELFLCHKHEMFDSFYSTIGRTHKSLNPVRRGPMIPTEILPPGDVIIPLDDDILDEVKQKSLLPLRLEAMDCHVTENATRHITNLYQQTKCPEIVSARRRSSAQRRSTVQQPEDSANLMSASGDSVNVPDGDSPRRSSARRSSVRRESEARRSTAYGDSVVENSAHRESESRPSSARRESEARRSSAYRESEARPSSARRKSARRSSAFQVSVPQLVVRRGQKFTVELSFDRPFDSLRDDIVVTFQFGDEIAGISNGSLISCRVSDGIKPNHWSAGLASHCKNMVIVQILSPSNSVIGRARLTIDTLRRRPDSTHSVSTSTFGSLSVADEYDVITGGQDVKEQADVDESEPRKDQDEDEEEQEVEETKAGEDAAEERRKFAEEDQRRKDRRERVKMIKHKRIIIRYVHTQPVYLLFNPWHENDQVYMGDHELCKQYVLSDVGNIFYGNEHQISARPWNYGQFEVGILDTAVRILDLARLRSTSRQNAVNVVRTISKLITPAEDHGLMEANWSGQYNDGTPSPLWTGSVPILTEFVETGCQPVKYGQCWVFAAVATTLCRTLGIPCRCVTNFCSAHDCDGNAVVNIHWNNFGEPVDEWNCDSLWSFHVWNEAFMGRPDIDIGLPRAWQAFDVTPQITTDGVYSAGPCSVKSIRRGEIFQRHDCAMLFYDINTDVIHWTLLESGDWRQIIERNRTGRLQLTEGPKTNVASRHLVASTQSSAIALDAIFPIVDVQSDCLDITPEYKFPQGSEEERATRQRASTFFSHIPVYDKGDGDVKYELEQRGPVPLGNEFSVVVLVQNSSRHERTVNLTLTVFGMRYTGVSRSKIRSEAFNFNLCSLRHRVVEMRVSVDDYSLVMSELSMFRVLLHATVDETDQMTCTFADFRLILPQLDIIGPKSVLQGDTFDFTVQLSSPMSICLQQCYWMVEALGMLPAVKIKQPTMEPYERAEATVAVTASRSGLLTIVASFHSREMTGVTGTMEVNVIAPGHPGADDQTAL